MASKLRHKMMTTSECVKRALQIGFLLAPALVAADGHLQKPSSAAELVKAVIHHEVSPASINEIRWKYLLTKQVNGKEETKEVVETNSGSIERLIAIAGRPLSSAQQHDETERILKLSHNPEAQKRLEQSGRKDAEQTNAFMQMIPNAFLFEYAGESGDLVKVTFKPNPQFSNSSREAKVLREMQGEIWINPKQQRLVSIHGQLMNDVKFAGGLLGHLEKGGQFSVKRAEIAPGDWEMTDLAVSMQGKALLFKSISVQQKELHRDFHRVPNNLTLSQAAGLLLQQASIAAQPVIVAER
ncbi:MAG TPA: hypothetical protein VFA90_09950 [Terriglobales bacterium]|nr:hypothetical protein [Terriglobales bacterium]